MDGWLKRLITEDLGLKAISLLLGVGIWYGVHRVTLDEVTLREVPVEVVMPRGKDWAVRASPAFVKLKIAGPKHLVENLQPGLISIRIPVDERIAPDGTERRVPVELSHLSLRLRGASLESSPPEIVVSVDERVEMPFDVRADVANPPPGFTIEKILVNPRAVMVRGPKSFLGAAKAKGATLETERVDPGYQEEGNFPFNGTRVIPVLDKLPVACTPEALTVLVSVSLAREHRRIEKIPLQRLENPRDPIRLVTIPEFVSIAIKGPKTVRLGDGKEKSFHDLAPEDFSACVAIPPGVGQGKHPGIPVMILRWPEGVSLDEAPPTVPVEIK